MRTSHWRRDGVAALTRLSARSALLPHTAMAMFSGPTDLSSLTHFFMVSKVAMRVMSNTTSAAAAPR
jgi:hypothetical protein